MPIVVPDNVIIPPISQQEAASERHLRDAQAIEGYTTPSGISLHSPSVLCARDGAVLIAFIHAAQVTACESHILPYE